MFAEERTQNEINEKALRSISSAPKLDEFLCECEAAAFRYLLSGQTVLFSAARGVLINVK